MQAWRWVMVGWLLGVTGCASLQGVDGFEPGKATIEQVRAKAKPDAQWPGADGAMTLEYDARPNSNQNLMMDFDAKGQLIAKRDVITLENMALLRTGMTRLEVRKILGNPRYVTSARSGNGEIWEWPLGAERSSFPERQIMLQFHPSTDGVVSISKSVRFP